MEHVLGEYKELKGTRLRKKSEMDAFRKERKKRN